MANGVAKLLTLLNHGNPLGSAKGPRIDDQRTSLADRVAPAQGPQDADREL